MLRNTRDALYSYPRLLDWTVVLAEAKTVREGTYWEGNGGVVSASTLSGQSWIAVFASSATLPMPSSGQMVMPSLTCFGYVSSNIQCE